MIERLADGPKGKPRALILAPTRELAFQIQGTVDKLGRSRGIFSTTVVGGADMNAQVRGLRQRPDIIIATPGSIVGSYVARHHIIHEAEYCGVGRSGPNVRYGVCPSIKSNYRGVTGGTADVTVFCHDAG